jgi:sodium/potassium/calcium exchanger 6
VFRSTLDDDGGDDGDGSCDQLHQQNSTTICDYIRREGTCDDVQTYVEFYYCGKSAHLKPVAWIAFITLLLLLFYLLGTAADQFFTPTLEVIGDALKMSPEVAGLTILALGNGAPDLSTAISSLALSKPIDIVTGGLFGAAMFVSTIVVAAVSFIGMHVKIDAPSFIRDISFYLVATVGVYFITWDGHVFIYEAIMFLLYYIAYVSFALITHYCGFCKPKRSSSEQRPTLGLSVNSSGSYIRLAQDEETVEGAKYVDDETASEFDGDTLTKPLLGESESEGGGGPEDSDDEDDDTPFTLTRWKDWFLSKSWLNRIWIAASTLVLLPLHLSVPSVKWNRYSYSTCLPATVATFYLALGYFPEMSERKIWISFLICMVVTTVLGVLLFILTSFDEPPKIKPAFVAVAFVTSVTWIAMVADQLVAVLQSMGVILGIPTFVLGATVLAWGNSVGDLVADIVMAKKGFPGSALSAAYGGPMMNMLIGMGIGLTIRCAAIFPAPVSVVASKSFLVSGGFLFVALYATLIVLWIRKFVLDWWWGAVLVAIYVLFNLFTGLIEGKVLWKGPIST